MFPVRICSFRVGERSIKTYDAEENDEQQESVMLVMCLPFLRLGANDNTDHASSMQLVFCKDLVNKLSGLAAIFVGDIC